MRTLKVVIADTDVLLQRLYSDLVSEEREYTVTECAANGPQLFEILRRADTNLVLLDVYLQDFDAMSEIEALRREFPRTDYIVLSSGEDPELVCKALCQGVFEYLVKPFSFERLRTSLRNYAAYYRGLTGRVRPWQQEDLDTLVSMKSPDPAWSGLRPIPKGLQPQYLDTVEEFLKNNSDTYSSQEIAETLGVSRSTSRRYLEFLLACGRVTAEYAYKKVGRPEKRYRIVLF